MNIYLVDDHLEFRKSLKLYLTLGLKYTVVGEADNGRDFLSDKRMHYADIVLMDINMPNLNGICATKLSIWDKSNLKIIAITMSCDNYGLNEIIGAGFKGFVCKDNIFNELNTALNRVIQGQLYFPDNMKIY
jgi:DNA-binding NarL/FixJ family response regulator